MERKVLKESVGCQDQTFAAVGGFNMIEFRSMGHFVVHRVPFVPSRIEEFEAHLLVFFTGIKRKAEELAARQARSVTQNRPNLKEMRRLVDEGYDVLSGGGPLSSFGELLHRSWLIKRGLDPAISNDLIDDMYRAGLEAGALGGKLLGAGGGGFLLLFVPPEKHAAVELRLAPYQRVAFRVNEPGTQIIHYGADTRPREAVQTREAV